MDEASETNAVIHAVVRGLVRMLTRMSITVNAE